MKFRSGLKMGFRVVYLSLKRSSRKASVLSLPALHPGIVAKECRIYSIFPPDFEDPLPLYRCEFCVCQPGLFLVKGFLFSFSVCIFLREWLEARQVLYRRNEQREKKRKINREQTGEGGTAEGGQFGEREREK